jgi:hypothetical protein
MIVEETRVSMWKARMMVMMMMMTLTLMCHRQGYLQTQHRWFMLTVLTTTHLPLTLQLHRLLLSQLHLKQMKLVHGHNLQVTIHKDLRTKFHSL